MSDDQDPTLRRLFAQNAQDPAPQEFMRELGRRIDARQRMRRLYSILAIVAGLVLCIVSAPWIAQITSTLIELAAIAGTRGPHLTALLIWSVLGASVAGCLPVIYLWRTGRW